jgi:hypothetical protein
MAPAVIFRNEQTKLSAIARIKAIRPDQDNPLAMWIGPHKKIRTLEANAAYWRLVEMVSRATGHDREVLHIFFKRKAFGFRVEQIGDELVEYTPSSAKASRGDFSQLIDFVQAFIAEFNIGESA